MISQSQSGQSTPEAMYPADLINAFGHVVMAAAWVEDKAGELIMLTSHNAGNVTFDPAPGWAGSGSVLIDKLQGKVQPPLANRLKGALEHRNYVVHGIALPGEHFAPSGYNGAPFWMFMKRKLGKTSPAGFDSRGLSADSLNALARELSAIEDLLDEEISIAMGLKTATISDSRAETSSPPLRTKSAQPAPQTRHRPDSMTL